MIATILIVVGILVAAVLVYAATKQNTFKVHRAALINASAERIFPMIDDLHAQSAWSPFEKDPAMKRTYSGAARGKGAVYEWDGNRQVGAGRIAIADSVPPSKVALLLDMIRPFKAHNTVEFTLEPDGTGTKVTWSMQGGQPYMAKVMSMFMDCDKMVGSQFDEGLAKLKRLVETPPANVAAE
jgi:Polyketide cyclase / dehydrase and lipid transport